MEWAGEEGGGGGEEGGGGGGEGGEGELGGGGGRGAGEGCIIKHPPPPHPTPPLGNIPSYCTRQLIERKKYSYFFKIFFSSKNLLVKHVKRFEKSYFATKYSSAQMMA